MAPLRRHEVRDTGDLRSAVGCKQRPIERATTLVIDEDVVFQLLPRQLLVNLHHRNCLRRHDLRTRLSSSLALQKPRPGPRPRVVQVQAS